MTIPKVVHFIWINGTRDFAWGEYVAVLSCILNTSYDVMLHTNLKPKQIKSKYNPYKLKKYKKFQIVKEDFTFDVNGLKLTFASLSDYHRMNILYEHGGIYSDTDILWFKDIEEDVAKLDFFGSYENSHPQYNTLTNAIIGSKKHYKPLLELNKEFNGIVEKVKEKGITDISDKTKYPKTHWTFFKPSVDFIRKHADLLLPQKEFYRNGARRIGKNLIKVGVKLDEYAKKLAGEVKDTVVKIQLEDVTGFHWYNYLYDFEDIIQLPGMKEKINNVLVEAEK
jgi:hypothetical protein